MVGNVVNIFEFMNFPWKCVSLNLKANFFENDLFRWNIRYLATASYRIISS